MSEIPADVMEAARKVAGECAVDTLRTTGRAEVPHIVVRLARAILAAEEKGAARERRICAEAVKALFRRYKRTRGMPMDFGHEEILRAIQGGSK